MFKKISKSFSILKVNDIKEFQSLVLKNPKPVLVDFWAEWCGPCHRLKPVLTQLANDNTKNSWDFAALNVDELETIAGDYKIEGIPCCVLIKDSKEVDRFVGVLSEQKIVEFLKKNNIEQ